MKLPNNSIGVSDIKQHDECAMQFAWKMRRHTAGGEPPEATDWTNAYGSAFHEAVAYAAAHNATDEEAIQAAFNSPYGRWLDPELQQRLVTDIATYRQRDYVGVRLVASEEDKRVPLFVDDDGTQIYFRFKLDRLYELLDHPGAFVHVDYKTSRHPKTKVEIDRDEQMSAYQWAIRELYPEVTSLLTLYDQLSYGRIPTRRTAEELENIKAWLIRKAKAILADEKLEPTLNDWCAYCPLMPSCPVIIQLTEYAMVEIAALAPEVKEGRKTTINLDPGQMATYVSTLETVANARRILDRYDERVRDTMKRMPADRLARLGYERRGQVVTEWAPEGLLAVIRDIGVERFTELVTLTKTAVEKLEPDVRAQVERYLVSREGTPRLQKRKVERVKK